jgi:hypothetical protein
MTEEHAECRRTIATLREQLAAARAALAVAGAERDRLVAEVVRPRPVEIVS